MCQPKSIRLNKKEQGYILIVVLAVLVLISLMITATYVSTESFLKESSFESDRRYARSLAEQAVKIGAQETAQLFSDPKNDIIPPVGSYALSGEDFLAFKLIETSNKLHTLDGKEWPQYFTNDCSGLGKHKGLCAPSFARRDKNNTSKYAKPLPPVYERKNVFNQYTGNSCGNAVTISQKRLPNISARPPCYVVEILDISPDTRTLSFRITAIAWGQHRKTTVKIESTYEMDYD